MLSALFLVQQKTRATKTRKNEKDLTTTGLWFLDDGKIVV